MSSYSKELLIRQFFTSGVSGMSPPDNGSISKTDPKFFTSGVSGMSQHPKLELLLYFSMRGDVDTNDLASRLIKHFRSFERVIHAESGDLLRIDGIKKDSVAFFKLFSRVADLYHISACDDVKMNGP